MSQRFNNEVSNANLDARHPWRAPLRGALKRVQFCSWQNCPEELLKLAG